MVNFGVIFFQKGRQHLNGFATIYIVFFYYHVNKFGTTHKHQN